MSGLREKIADAIREAHDDPPTWERRIDLFRHQADAVLRVLAEHGDAQQVRGDAVTVLVATELLGELNEWSQPVRVRVDETPGVGTGYEMTFQTVDADRADLAAARQQLEQLRAEVDRLSKITPVSEPEADVQAAYTSALFAILDAPARPAGHDESGQ